MTMINLFWCALGMVMGFGAGFALGFRAKKEGKMDFCPDKVGKLPVEIKEKKIEKSKEEGTMENN